MIISGDWAASQPWVCRNKIIYSSLAFARFFFKGLISEEEIANQTLGTSSSDVLAYGLGNWYLYEKQDSLKAKVIYERLLEKGNRYSFAYLVAESDYKRLFAED